MKNPDHSLSSEIHKNPCKHWKRLKVVSVLPWARSGSYFLSSLLDNHPNILTIPTNIISGFFSEYWPQIENYIEDKPNCLPIDYSSFFFSILKYGPFPGVDEELLKQKLATSLSPVKELNAGVFFVVLHFVYEELLGRNVQEKTIINYQFHGTQDLDELTVALKTFPDMKFLGIHREPIRAHASHLNALRDVLSSLFHEDNLKVYEILYKTDWHGNYYRHILLGWRPFETYFGVNVFEVCLEKLHADPEKEIKRVATWLNIPFCKTLLESTFAGTVHSQTSYSSQPVVSGFQKPPQKSLSSPNFNALDFLLIRTLMREEDQKHGYRAAPAYMKTLAWLLLIIPMKLEYIAIFKAIRNRNSFQLRGAIFSMWDRICSSYRYLLRKRMTIRRRKSDDLYLTILEKQKERDAWINEIITELTSNNNKILGLAPANDLVANILEKIEQPSQFYIFDMNPAKSFPSPIHSYEQAKELNLDVIYIISPNYGKEIAKTFRMNGLKKSKLHLFV